MPEFGGGFEQFTGAASSGAEKSQESAEKYQERQKQQKQQQQRDQRQEASKKQDDNSLASVIVQFLGDPAHTQHFLLISRLVARNIPSDLILAILALVYEPARLLIEQKFAEKFLKLEAPPNENISSNSKVRIDDWINKIFLVATSEPHRTLETALDIDKKIDPQLIQLSIFILREYLEKMRKEEVNFENLQNFCVAFWQKLMKQLVAQTKEQNLLEDKNGEVDN